MSEYCNSKEYNEMPKVFDLRCCAEEHLDAAAAICKRIMSSMFRKHLRVPLTLVQVTISSAMFFLVLTDGTNEIETLDTPLRHCWWTELWRWTIYEPVLNTT